MQAHIVEIDVDQLSWRFKYKWKCSCGQRGRWWCVQARSARNGGAKHVAVMERGK